MPGMTGYDVCRKIRQDARTQDTPVIFLTAKGLLMDMAEGEDAGSDLYLIKPVLATKLLNMVGDVPLRRQPAGQAAADAQGLMRALLVLALAGRRRGPRGRARRRVRDALRRRGVAARGAGGGPRALPRVRSHGTSTPSRRSWTPTPCSSPSRARPPAAARRCASSGRAFFDPAGPSLTWEPYEGEVGSQGDLGYTRGKFLFQGKDGAGKPVTERGEYLSIWRKQQDGAWRLVVDSSLPAADRGWPPVKGAPSRVITEGASGDLRYSLVATRVEPAATGPDAGAGRERRVARVERRASDGTWSTAVQAVTYGTAPNQ